MAEKFPSNLFFFFFEKKTCLLCEVSASQQKLQLFLRKTNIKKWKHFDGNPKYLSQKKSDPQCVCFCLYWNTLIWKCCHTGFCQSNSHSHSPPWTECLKSAPSWVVGMAEVLGLCLSSSGRRSSEEEPEQEVSPTKTGRVWSGSNLTSMRYHWDIINMKYHCLWIWYFRVHISFKILNSEKSYAFSTFVNDFDGE